MRERGRTPESVREQYERAVRPMFRKYVLPTRQYAHFLVSGEGPVEEGVARLLARVRGD